MSHLTLVHSAPAKATGTRMNEGFVQVPNAVFDAIFSTDLSPNELKVLLAVVRKTAGFGKVEDDMTISSIAKLIGVHRPDASVAYNALVQRSILSARKGKYGQITSVCEPSAWQTEPLPNQRKAAKKKPAKPLSVVPNTPYEIPTPVGNSYGQTSEIPTHNIQPQQTTTEVAKATLSPAVADDAETVSIKPAKQTLPACPHEKLIALYHEMLPTCTQVREWNATRQKFMRTRWREKLEQGKYATEETGLAYWRRLFAYIAESDFLMGRTPPAPGKNPFNLDMEWIITPGNFAKIVEGKYHKKGDQ